MLLVICDMTALVCDVGQECLCVAYRTAYFVLFLIAPAVPNLYLHYALSLASPQQQFSQPRFLLFEKQGVVPAKGLLQEPNGKQQQQ